MSKRSYHTQTADLIESAFEDLALSCRTTAADWERARLSARADLKIKSAQALAALAAAAETRNLALATLASLTDVAGDPASPDLAQEAYILAAMGLGLVADAEDMSVEDLRAALSSEGDADRDAGLGDLP